MNQDNAQASDELKSTLAPNPFVLPRKQYQVLSPNGLFKNGRQYATGEYVELDEKTAANFIATGDLVPLAEVTSNAQQ